jgi:hypothetical protein
MEDKNMLMGIGLASMFFLLVMFWRKKKAQLSEYEDKETASDGVGVSLAAVLKAVRVGVGIGYLDMEQEGSIAQLFSEWKRLDTTKDLRKLAYILATSKNETWFRNIKEVWGGHALQPQYYPQGWYGRGLSQVTWQLNYQKFQTILGIPLVSNPDLALRADVGARILVYGMIHGVFTSGGLSSSNNLNKYFNGNVTDWYNARRIVNGTDKMVAIGDVAYRIWANLKA